MTPGLQDWACLGRPPSHSADLETVWNRPGFASPEIAIQRCRVCGLLYHILRYELSDWGPSGDYYDQTTIWTPLDPDEIEAAQRDPHYRPRSSKSHRHDTGWRSG